MKKLQLRKNTKSERRRRKQRNTGWRSVTLNAAGSLGWVFWERNSYLCSHPPMSLLFSAWPWRAVSMHSSGNGRHWQRLRDQEDRVGSLFIYSLPPPTPAILAYCFHPVASLPQLLFSQGLQQHFLPLVPQVGYANGIPLFTSPWFAPTSSVPSALHTRLEIIPSLNSTVTSSEWTISF